MNSCKDFFLEFFSIAMDSMSWGLPFILLKLLTLENQIVDQAKLITCVEILKILLIESTQSL